MAAVGLTGKQRKFLKAAGSGLNPLVLVGKAGVGPTVITGAGEALAVYELIKVRILPNCPVAPAPALTALAGALGAELVQIIGRNGLLYKPNPESQKIGFPE